MLSLCVWAAVMIVFLYVSILNSWTGSDRRSGPGQQPSLCRRFACVKTGPPRMPQLVTWPRNLSAVIYRRQSSAAVFSRHASVWPSRPRRYLYCRLVNDGTLWAVCGRGGASGGAGFTSSFTSSTCLMSPLCFQVSQTPNSPKMEPRTSPSTTPTGHTQRWAHTHTHRRSPGNNRQW